MHYDTTLKQLFQSAPSYLLELLAGAPPVELLTVEYPAVKMRRPDLVFRLADGEIHQLELQSDNDEEMDYRMLEYYPPLCRSFGRPPVQTVLYVDAAPLTMTGGLTHPQLTYRYRVSDIRAFDAAPLLASNSTADNVLALLCHNGATRASVKQILQQIARLPVNQQMDSITQLLVLSGLRRVENVIKQEVKKMPIEINVMENAFLREAFLDGEKQGKKEGQKHGETRLLQQLLEQRFGKLPKWALQQLEAANTATLERWGKRLLKAKSLAEVVPRT